MAATPLGLKKISPTFTQGSSCLATLGFEPESLWDSSAVIVKIRAMPRPEGITPAFLFPAFRFPTFRFS
jgi:hypothetical protein